MAYSFQTFSVGEVLTATKMNQIEVNIRDHEHGLSGVSGAKVMVSTNDTTPDYLVNKIVGDVTASELNDGANEDCALYINAAAVAQSELKTTTGTVSAAPIVGAGTNLTLPGGEYGFYPRIRSSVSNTWRHQISFDTSNTSYVTNIYVENSGGTGPTAYVIQRYIQASPPYDLGDGAIGLFVFAHLRPDGTIDAVYAAQDPPWALNGPTDITPSRIDKTTGRKYKLVPRGFGPDWRARFKTMTEQQKAALIAKLRAGDMDELEITQEIKNKDMPLIPHPFVDGAGDGTIVLIDPVGFADELAKCHERGVDVNDLLHEGYVNIDNNPLSANAPPGVIPVAARWKLTV